MKVFVIGSLSCEEEIRKVAKFFEEERGDEVDYVRKQPEKPLEILIREAFESISKADRVVAVRKPDGTFGDGTLYEMTFANFIGKPITKFRRLKRELADEKRLTSLPQYHIDRDKLCEIVKETIGYKRLMDAFCHGTVVCDEFAWFSNSDEYYIIHLESGMMVNWYKHLGRTNTCSQSDRTIDDYYEFFRLFKEELDYFKRRN